MLSQQSICNLEQIHTDLMTHLHSSFSNKSKLCKDTPIIERFEIKAEGEI